MWQRRAAFACRRSPEREGERERESKRERHIDTSDTEVDHPDKDTETETDSVCGLKLLVYHTNAAEKSNVCLHTFTTQTQTQRHRLRHECGREEQP